ncbi:MAG: SLC13 family permease [Candidatus Krumholzibacteria bacterium]|nr:SLC13 family permease [Candidatus Krumholzibacteria bacterium]
MTLDMAIVLGLAVGAIVLFATERLRIDLIAMLLMGTLLLLGLVSPDEGVAGFSNPATVTVAAMFIISAALYRTGAVLVLGRASAWVFERNVWAGLVVMMVSVGLLSAFMNNTPVVAIFMPIVLSVAATVRISPSKLLMPLSFASMFGGVCTLIGTSTNLLVSAIAARSGYEPFHMFEFTRFGLVLFAVGTAYMLLVVRWIPDRRAVQELTREYGMGRYMTEVELQEDACSIGFPLAESPLVQEVGVEILEINRRGHRIFVPHPRTELQAGDTLRVVCDVDRIKSLAERQGIRLKPRKLKDTDMETAETVLVEAVVAPGSVLVGETLKSSRFRNVFGANVLALRHRGTVVHEKLGNTTLLGGDVLLIEARSDHLDILRNHEAFVMVSEVALPVFRREKALLALAVVAGVVVTAALGIVPILVSAVAGSVLLVLSGCLQPEEAYHAIDWKVIFLLAGALSLGTALENSGAAVMLSSLLIKTAATLGPVAVISGLYLATSLMTESMSNNATAVLLAPIAIGAAQLMNVDPRPLLMAVTFAASASFMTPVGYQTNTMIYGVGQYRFRDFLRVGGPLNLIFWVLATFLIPVFWPLTPLTPLP